MKLNQIVLKCYYDIEVPKIKIRAIKNKERFISRILNNFFADIKKVGQFDVYHVVENYFGDLTTIPCFDYPKNKKQTPETTSYRGFGATLLSVTSNDDAIEDTFPKDEFKYNGCRILVVVSGMGILEKRANKG